MPRKRGPFRFEGDVAAHPAVIALGSALPDFGRVERVEVLKERGSTRGVYRLWEGAPGGRAVIAKRGSADTVRKERHVYETVLPSLGSRSLELLGVAADSPGSLWIFLEAAEGAPFDEQDAHHRSLAGSWLAQLHTHEWSAATRSVMPLRDMSDYREALDRSVSTLRRVTSTNDLLPREGAAMIGGLESRLRDLQLYWESFAEEKAPIADTVVHSDVQPKNMVVSPGGSLLVFDWEHSGWGDPCRDLDPCVDLERYCSVAAERRPWLTVERLRRMSVKGELLRLVDAIAWDSVRLDSPWWQRALRHMEYYARDLRLLNLELLLGSAEMTR